MSKPKTKPTDHLSSVKSVLWNPDQQDLRRMTEEMPNTRTTRFDNTNTQTRVDSRSKLSTYIATDTPERHDSQTITRQEYQRVSRLQAEYMRDAPMIVIDGFIGNDPEFRVPARLVMERSNANVAAMQQHLYYPVTDEERRHFEPRLTVIYTPNLAMPGYPSDRLIAVDLEEGITRVFNSDYFGESKKGGLRMWNQIVYDRGGLALHAGCKVIPVGDRNRVGLIIGLSGTGKTTTTFTKQNNSSPVQVPEHGRQTRPGKWRGRPRCKPEPHRPQVSFVNAIERAPSWPLFPGGVDRVDPEGALGASLPAVSADDACNTGSNLLGWPPSRRRLDGGVTVHTTSSKGGRRRRRRRTSVGRGSGVEGRRPS